MQEIKELRNKVGLSQSQFARYFDIPIGTIHNWEQEVTHPPKYVPSMIRKLITYEKEQIEKFAQDGGDKR